jgi:hypothetical protein
MGVGEVSTDYLVWDKETSLIWRRHPESEVKADKLSHLVISPEVS